ncbi:MAG: hypothetical protein ACLPX9_04110 [Rhodomicrobium sp.]
MLKKLVFLLPVCAGLVSGCMSTPPLSEATGTEHSDIMIKDVVVRVKCELSGAFDQKVQQREFRWLADWTAHADLTLQVNDNAGISPSGSYTKADHWVKNIDAGPTGGKGTAASPFTYQSFFPTFALSANANLNGGAVRAETISFTVALDELKRWREQLDRREANLPPEKKTCYFDGELGVTGNLGLKEWVDSAFYPVKAGELHAGVHPFAAGGGGAKGGAQGPSTGGPAPKAEVQLTRQYIQTMVQEWTKKLAELQKQTKDAFSKIDAAVKNLQDADSQLQTKFKALKSQYNAVLDPYLKKAFAEGRAFDKYLKDHQKYQDSCTAYKTTLADASTMLGTVKTDLTKSTGDVTWPLSDDFDKLSTAMDAIEANDYPKQATDCAAALQKEAEQGAKYAQDLPNQIDPPVDSVVHSLTFVVAYGAGISPNWTLLQWKGPGAGATPMLSASGTRTHTLNIALAPRTAASNISQDALRQLNNQVVRSGYQ